jgi:hypothetical protein
MAVQPKCPICGLDLMSNGGKDDNGKVIEAQVQYWMHDPRNLHRDIQVTAHQVCVDKAKTLMPNFDKPTQADYANPKFPSIARDGTLNQKNPAQIINSKIQ